MSIEDPSQGGDPLIAPDTGDILDASRRLKDVSRLTPLEQSAELSSAVDGDVRMKLELLNATGSFKVRGAHNRILRLAVDDPIVTASSGNHALAVLTAAAATHRSATILVGRTVTAAKLDVLRRFETDRIRVEVLDVGSDEAELVARARSESDGSTYVAPYNDRWVIAGQGTIGLEVMDAWPACDTFVVPIGGGGLISGIARWAKSVRPEARIIGVQPTASPTLHEFLRTGSREPLTIGKTLADGVAGNLEPSSITWELCRELVDDVVLIDEDAIRRAIRWAIEVPHLLLEGSAALPIAAILEEPTRFTASSTCLVLTGRWVDADIVSSVLAD